MSEEIKFTLRWMQPGNGLYLDTGAAVFGFDTPGGWGDIVRDYQQYAVTGLSYQWCPGIQRGTEALGTNMAIPFIAFANDLNIDDADMNPMNMSQLVRRRDYYTTPYVKEHRRYIDLRPLAKD